MLEAILGWVGTAGSLVAYVLLVRGHLGARSRIYLGTNAIAATFAGTASVMYGAWPSAASNFVWVIMSLYPAINDMRREAAHRRLAEAEATEPATTVTAPVVVSVPAVTASVPVVTAVLPVVANL
ncbi:MULTISPECIES: hypothetical protein [Microbacterium]|uniref:CBU_0592 family membrane protein n=1 Tax=Microbacterium TaxID=33882 RepID=UPI000D64ED31|nr:MULTISPECIES: hypothetical protein [Microbacterium]